MTLPEALSWIASAVSLSGLWFYGNQGRLGPLIGIASQGLWIALALSSGLSGLIVSSLVYVVIHARNLYRLRRNS